MTTKLATSKPRFGFFLALGLAGAVAACADDSKPMQAASPTPAPMAAPAPAAAPAKPMSRKEQAMQAASDRNKAVQTALNKNGANLTVDGRMGPKTAAALKAFQKANKLAPTGYADPKTRAALGV